MSKIIRLSPYKLDDKNMVDMRYWNETRTGPKPVGPGLQFEMRFVPQMIRALQQVWHRDCEAQARASVLQE